MLFILIQFHLEIDLAFLIFVLFQPNSYLEIIWNTGIIYQFVS